MKETIKLPFKSNKERSKYSQIQEGKRFVIPFLLEVEGKPNL